MNDDDRIIDTENWSQLSVDPVYPDERTIEEKSEELAVSKVQEFLSRLLPFVLTADNSRLTLAAYAFAVGCDLTYLFGDSTETAIAKGLGVSKQNFSKTVHKICQQHNIKRTQKGTRDEEKVYSLANKRVVKSP